MKRVKCVAFAAVLSLGMITITSYNLNNDAKADTSVDMKQTVIMRTANLSGDKVIKAKGSENEAIQVSSSAQGSNGVKITRGGSSAGNSDVISYAYQFMGKPYVWGAAGPSAFDCSGFTAYVFSKFGIQMDHYTGSQFDMGTAVSKDKLAAGDLVFFNTYSSVSHVGIYIGGGNFIHASSGSHKVTVSNLSESYYSQRYAGARRVLR
ncbi:MAG: C40 family peptidase [Bacillota bacterium]|nr:C40 family peptidase [Bacillota bacterium]